MSLKIKFYTKTGCPFCSSIEQGLMMAKLIFEINEVKQSFEIQKIDEVSEEVPRLVYCLGEQEIGMFKGFPVADDQSLQWIIVLRHIIVGLFEVTKDEKIAQIILKCDNLYFYGEPQFFMMLSEINDVNKLKELLITYPCESKKKNIERRLHELQQGSI